ncbi:ABC-2 family transporter protein [Rubripirellula obstinata]|uniref:ABC-2 family transporter protein n=1 Tax=Rubripirellula obstinata TaxID=406547 RepID=A0A5B1CND3_9BACT|nr:ABC transporter permease subunit/CPBP intramembrane protease [Rubripirellula obstinata]KAA1261299.1 ABC-2 family transporter protein [Rubripirellula obstinata]
MSERSEQLREKAKRAGRPRLSVVWMIYAREMMDQLRDRRTLFTIAVLPILLYPLVGMLLMQIAQFTQQHPTSICIVGTDHLIGDVPPLVKTETFVDGLTDNDERLELLCYTWNGVGRHDGVLNQAKNVKETTNNWVRDGIFDAVLVIPPKFADPQARSSDQEASMQLLYNVASDQSMVARDRLTGILSKWQSGWVRQRLETTGIDISLLAPFKLADIDIAPERTREAAFWSKLLPFIMLVWAMTGAFYPAIDLVAGEKERGTLETLLCSPALRSEIVWGKLGAVTTFSMMTAILNAGSMLVTSSFVFKQMGVGGGQVGSPPMVPMLWLLVALVPLSALFSALALAVAAMARSSKEGQYYLMPLMMVTLPLVLLPMLPGTTLTAGTSLIPVTGMFLMVRSLVEGQYAHALMYLPIVAAVTAGCLWLAVTWARRQFEDEAVLFGGGDQWELSQWVRHLWRDRQRAATPTQAFSCGAIILVALFFGKLVVTEMPTTFAGIAKLVMMPQIGMILAPTLMMATVLTTSLKHSLRIRLSNPLTLPIAVVFGICLHPTYVMLAGLVSYAYPISEQATAAMKPFTDQISSAPLMSVIFLMAVVPAICEELAFRGFIFGGLVRNRGKLRAIFVTAIMFGISHGVLQQSICATFMGLLLGYLALKTGSVLPGILIHMTNNTLSVSLERIAQSTHPAAQALVSSTGGGPEYNLVWVIASVAIASMCLFYFIRLPSVDEDAKADLVGNEEEFADPTAALSPA